MPKPTTNFNDSNGSDLGSVLITKEYLSSVYPNIDGGQMQIFGWGGNSNRELGVNDNIRRSTPVQEFTSSTTWKQVSTEGAAIGGSASTAIKTDGTLWTWGSNIYAQLGDNTTATRSTPVQEFSSSTNWRQVAFGCGQHMAATKTDGTLWTWGRNNNAQLATGDTDGRSTPVQEFSSSTNWKQVSCGYQHTAAIKTDGTLWTWGRNDNAQLATGDTNGRTTPVQEFSSSTNWKQVACGNAYIAAIKTDGTLWLWGSNNAGQLGTNGVDTRTTPVQEFSSSTNWKQVACGLDHTAAIKTDGTLWLWGSNVGQLGINASGSRQTPVQEFTSSTNWRWVGCGRFNTASIKTDGTLWTWGRNNNAQLGVNDNIDRSTPVQEFSSSTNWIQVSISPTHAMALKAPLLGPQ